MTAPKSMSHSPIQETLSQPAPLVPGAQSLTRGFCERCRQSRVTQQLIVPWGQQLLERRHDPRAIVSAHQLDKRLEPGGERGCRPGGITGQQRYRGAVVVIKLAQRTGDPLERPGTR